MFEFKKFNIYISLFFVFILLISGIAGPSSQNLRNSSSMEFKEEEINVLGDGGSEINAISIDIKIQKVDETGSGIAEFF